MSDIFVIQNKLSNIDTDIEKGNASVQGHFCLRCRAISALNYGCSSSAKGIVETAASTSWCFGFLYSNESSNSTPYYKVPGLPGVPWPEAAC